MRFTILTFCCYCVLFLCPINSRCENRETGAQILDKAGSSISFHLNSALFDVTGKIKDYTATLSPGPRGLAGGRLSARFNINSIVFDPMPPEKLFMLKGLLAMVREPTVEFQSSQIVPLDRNQVRIDGQGIYEGRKHPVSSVAKTQDESSGRTRLSGSVSSDALSLPAVKSIEQFCGKFTGTARYDLRFSQKP